MKSAARSLTEPPGFRNSHLPRISHPVASDGPWRRISGVFPISSTKPGTAAMTPHAPDESAAPYPGILTNVTISVERDADKN